MSSVLVFGLASHILKGVEENRGTKDVLRVYSQSESGPGLFDDLKEQGESLEVVILGSGFIEPIQMAQRIYAIDKTISVLILAGPDDLSRLQKAVQFSLFITDQVVCVADDKIDNVLRAVSIAITRTRNKRKHSRIVHEMNAGLAKNKLTSDNVSIHLDKLLDYAPMAVAILSAESHVVAWNRRARDLAELAERDVLFKSMDLIFSSQSGQTFNEGLKQAQAGLSTIYLEATRYVRGELRTFEFTIGALPETAKQVVMIIFHDITERKRSETSVLVAKQQAEAANESKSRFLANMSHEIRTPIGAILGFLDLMRQPGLGAKDLEEFIATIDRNGHQLLRLIDDILDISKIEAGRVEIVKADFSLIELFADVQSLMGFRAREKGLNLFIEFKTPIPEFIIGDAVRLRQILTNVVGNAIKFTESGSIRLVVNYVDQTLTCRVDDTGIGLSQSQATSLFTPFMQADPTITRRFGGTGLGLALSQKLANLLGGDLQLLHSEFGKGSSFELTLRAPVPASTAFVDSDALLQSKTTTMSNEQTKISALLKMRILIVEDSRDNQILISRYLISEGAKVEFANDGLEGITKALSSKFDVIVMDMQMPRCDGLEATRRLRQEGYDRPIVALTAHAMEEERRKAFAAGCTDYLTKPIDRARLASVLSRYRNV